MTLNSISNGIEAILFIHKGTIPDYLELALKVAAISNSLPVHLVTDQSNLERSYDENKIFLHDISRYIKPEDESDLDEIFVHDNLLDKDYESFCFLRYYVARNFMRENFIDKILYLDSDLLLFEDVNTLFDTDKGLMSIVRSATYVTGWSIQVLESFIDSFKGYFSNLKDESRICDMLALDYFIDLNPSDAYLKFRQHPQLDSSFCKVMNITKKDTVYAAATFADEQKVYITSLFRFLAVASGYVDASVNELIGMQNDRILEISPVEKSTSHFLLTGRGLSLDFNQFEVSFIHLQGQSKMYTQPFAKLLLETI